MGIPGLIKEVSEAIQPIRGPAALMRQLGNQVAGIDGHTFLHQRVHTVGDKIYLKEEGAHEAYINYFRDTIRVLLDAKIYPLVVFDGMSLPAKKETNQKRQQQRDKELNGIQQLLQENESEARKKMRSVPVTEQMVRNVILNLQAAGIPYLVAPYEADAQLAFLAHNNIIDFVIAEDSDLIVFGVRKILFKLKRNPLTADLFEAVNLRKEYKDLNFLRKACILSGCDYLANIPGIGLQTALTFMRSLKPSSIDSDEAFIDCLHRLPLLVTRKRISVSNDYCFRFRAAEFCFKHQLVYCPIRQHFVPLTPYPSGQPSSSSSLSSAAKVLCSMQSNDDGVISDVPNAGADFRHQSVSSSSCLATGESSPEVSAEISSNKSDCQLAVSNQEMINLCGSRLASAELEYHHSLGNVSSKSMQLYEEHVFENKYKDWLTHNSLKIVGMSLCSRPLNWKTILGPDLQEDEMHDADSEIGPLEERKGAAAAATSVSIDEHKQDGGEFVARNLIQGHPHNAASPNPASDSKHCHESGGLSRPTPVTQSALHVETRKPNEATETTPTRSGKRAMSFQSRPEDRQTLTGSEAKKESASLWCKKRKGCGEKMRRDAGRPQTTDTSPQSSAYFIATGTGVKKRKSEADAASLCTPSGAAPWRLKTVPLSADAFLCTPSASSLRKFSSLPSAVRCSQADRSKSQEKVMPAGRSAVVGRASILTSPFIREDRKSEAKANNEKSSGGATKGNAGSQKLELRISRVRHWDSEYFAKTSSPSSSAPARSKAIRLRTGRPLDDQTNISYLTPAQFIKQRKQLFSLSSSYPATPQSHRLPTGRRIEDQNADKCTGSMTGMTSGKTTSPPLRLPRHLHTGNSPSAAASSPSRSTTTQISGDSGYDSSPA